MTSTGMGMGSGTLSFLTEDKLEKVIGRPNLEIH
jgi:hypothetical protein